MVNETGPVRDQKVPDEAWATPARNARSAVTLLGYATHPQCLPDEPGPCGGNFAVHMAAYLGTIKAICDHQMDHLGPQFGDIYASAYETALEQLIQCGHSGHRHS